MDFSMQCAKILPLKLSDLLFIKIITHPRVHTYAFSKIQQLKVLLLFILGKKFSKDGICLWLCQFILKNS